jgi:hypothetical protein
MTPEQQIARRKKVASAARALIAGELGLVPASIQIQRALNSLGEEKPSAYKTFGQFFKAIPPEMPLGAARLHWQIDRLIEHDLHLAQIENEFRPALLRAATELLKEFEQ